MADNTAGRGGPLERDVVGGGGGAIMTTVTRMLPPNLFVLLQQHNLRSPRPLTNAPSHCASQGRAPPAAGSKFITSLLSANSLIFIPFGFKTSKPCPLDYCTGARHYSIEFHRLSLTRSKIARVEDGNERIPNAPTNLSNIVTPLGIGSGIYYHCLSSPYYV